ncbi:ABC transporter ATP-binding protein [Amorphus orientalis]|uniref:Branched-chain amino acid transport system ATP-binding protein n=1 Tax=Amorphus orientalis TaxID=649198 RepID=A0AAE3VQN9_9HYPH|nr:ABC transporter ATP-binding protein [Amorphus orientalis]MDQ0316090.1 branched-chain amino acid transport system ATP-binding protein [Amorphus orientalis]
MSALSVQDIGITFGGVKAVDSVSFSVEDGQIFSIIGPNGAGKTTLFNLISGVYVPMSGRVTLQGQDVTAAAPNRLAARGLSRTFQNLQIFFRMTVAENVMVGRHLKEERGVFPHLFSLPSVIRQNRHSRKEALRLLERIGLADRADDLAANLPYGELKRLEIARALATEPKVLLLDEPAAGCNARETENIEHMIKEIAETGVTVVLVEHDMRLVMRISDRIHVLDYGRTLTEGNAEEVRTNPEVVKAYLGTHGAEEAARAQD